MTTRVRHMSHVRARGLFEASVLIFAALLFSSHMALAQFSQQGPKLVGTGAVGSAAQGQSVALSADGNTAIVGGPKDDTAKFGSFITGAGAAWVYTRSGGIWTQQGGKLVGTGAVGLAQQGWSVALSADGDTAIVGGPNDDGIGAAWVYIRRGGVWTQQGSKLVGTGTVGITGLGWSVALSADGNTAIVGGPFDNTGTGAVWVFTRSGGVWRQQGGKLVGTGAVGEANQGTSVAVSADGNTAVVGGFGDNSRTGAVWVFTRSGGVWRQQGGKLVGTGAVGQANQGWSVALSGDSNTAMVGGNGDNGFNGAAWVFTRSGGVWTQQGSKLVGTGAVGRDGQGGSVALSGDGNTAVVGGVDNDFGTGGGAWVFTRSGGVWTQLGSKLVGTGAVEPAEQGVSVALSADAVTAIVGGFGDNSNTGAAWVYLQPILRISPPRDTVISGIFDRPFPRTSFHYQLRSTFDSVGFSISGIPSWLNANFTSGKATTMPLKVTFSLIDIGKLKPGTYTATIAFTNTVSGLGNTTRKVTLIVKPPGKHEHDKEEQ